MKYRCAADKDELQDGGEFKECECTSATEAAHWYARTTEEGEEAIEVFVLLPLHKKIYRYFVGIDREPKTRTIEVEQL